jgi:hypothetical protein
MTLSNSSERVIEVLTFMPPIYAYLRVVSTGFLTMFVPARESLAQTLRVLLTRLHVYPSLKPEGSQSKSRREVRQRKINFAGGEIARGNERDFVELNIFLFRFNGVHQGRLVTGLDLILHSS